MNDKVSINNHLEQFGEKLKLGMSAIRDAAEIYVKALRQYSFAQRRFEERYPDIKKDTWQRLRDIGSGKLVPEAMMFRPVAAQTYRALPIKTQKALISGSVDLALNDGTVVNVPYARLSDSQCGVVVNVSEGKIRSIEEQREILKKNLKPKRKRVAKKGYRVIGDTVKFFADTILTVMDIERILAEMKKGMDNVG